MRSQTSEDFERRRAVSDMLRAKGQLVSLTLVDGRQVHGEIVVPFPQGLRDGVVGIWPFGAASKTFFLRDEVVGAAVFVGSSKTLGKATEANRAADEWD